MRRFAAAALSAAALSATLIATGSTANAATGNPVPFGNTAQAGSGAQAPGQFVAESANSAPKPSSKKHYFTISGVSGAYTTGDWYWTKQNGPHKIIVELAIHDTKRDGKLAGLALSWNYHGQHGHWYANSRDAAGSTAYGWVSFLPQVTNLRGLDMVGTIRGNAFYASKVGPWVSIRK